MHRLLDPEVPAAKTVAALRDFIGGSGKGVASTLFNREELANLNRFAVALQSTIRPDGKVATGAAAEAGQKASAKAMDLIAGTYSAKVGQRAIVGGLGARAARRSFEGGAPRLLAPPPMLPLNRLATGEGLALGER